MVEILCNIGDEREVIEEERQDWLQKVLVALGADPEIISENSMKAREHIMFLELDVFSNVDGSIKIYRPEHITFEYPSEDPEREYEEVTVEARQKLVAEWKEPELIRIRDEEGEYYKIILSEWALPLQMKG